MRSRSATFQAETTWRRESGSARRPSTTAASWSMRRPSGRRPGAPLRAVDRPQLAVGVRPLVPDRDPVLAQRAHVGLAAQEPQQLVDDRAQVELLGGERREALAQVEAQLVAEERAACRCRCGRSSRTPWSSTWRRRSRYWRKARDRLHPSGAQEAAEAAARFPSFSTCRWPAPSPPRPGASRPARSQVEVDLRNGLPQVQIVGLPDAGGAREPRAGARGDQELRLRPAAARRDHQPGAGRPAQGGQPPRPGDRARLCSPRTGRCRRRRSTGGCCAASWGSTAACGRCAAGWRSPTSADAPGGARGPAAGGQRRRGRGAGLGAGDPARRARRRDRAPARAAAAAGGRRRRRPRRRPTARQGPTSPTCAARRAPSAPSRSPPPAATTCCSSGRRARARRCSRSACPGSCRRSPSREAIAVTKIHSLVAEQPPTGLRLAAAVPQPASRHSARPGWSAAGRSRGPAKSASPTPACSSSTSCRSSAATPSRPCASRSRTASVTVVRARDGAALPGPLRAARRDEPLPLRPPRRPAPRVPLPRRPRSSATAPGSRGRCSTASTSTSRCRR